MPLPYITRSISEKYLSLLNMHTSALPDATVSQLDISLLGSFQLKLDGRDIAGKLKYRKAIYLLAYLVMASGRWIAREKLAELLWPDLPAAAALTNLRQVLNNLSKVINTSVGVDVIQSRRDSIACFSDARVHVDIAFLINDWQADDPDTLFCAWLTNSFEPRLTELNHDFLERMELNVGTDLQAWIHQVRKQLRERWRDLAARLCREQEQTGRIASAVALANQLWEQDNLNENTAAKLIRLLLSCGDFKRANVVLTTLEQNLLAAFGTRASASTRRLLQQDPMPAVDDPIVTENKHAALISKSVTEIRWLTLAYVEFDLLPHAGTDEADLVLRMDQLLCAVQEKISLWGGTCTPVFGQGFHASFGMHTEPEQAALRSIYAAQEIMLADQARQHLRIGICAGNVQCTHGEMRFLGTLPRMAQELCWSAAVGDIVFDSMMAEQIRMKLANDAIAVSASKYYAHDMLRFKLARQTMNAEMQQEFPLVGRAEELQMLWNHWRLAKQAQPQWLILRGNAGMGKTRLATEVSRQLDTADNHVIRIFCTLEYQHQSLAALRHALSELLALSSVKAGEYSTSIRARLQELLPDYEPEEATLHALISLFDQNMRVEADSKNQIFAALGMLFDQLSRRKNCLVLIDDFHWSDFATREFLARYAGSLEQQRLLLLVTTRPDAPLEHAGASPVVIELSPLAVSASEQMVAACDHRHLLSATEQARIAQDCGGIPLFIERLTRSRTEDGQHHLIPVKELLQSELDKLGPYKNILQMAAVVGNNFHARILSSLLPDEDVGGPLQLAISYRLIQASAQHGHYHFQHALIADAAYQSFPEKQRRTAHLRVAEHLLDEPGVSSAEVARHFEEAHEWQQAAALWTISGQKALASEFAMDALHDFGKALDIALQPHAGLTHLQIPLRLAMGNAALLCQGYGSQLGYQQFLAVCDSLNNLPAPDHEETESLFRALSGLYMGGSSQGKSDGLGIARRLEELANTPAKRLMACFALGNSLFWRGLFVEALRYQQEGLSIAKTLSIEERQRYWGEDLEILIRAFLCWNLWFMGEGHAHEMATESTLLARERKKSHALCFMLTFNTALCWTAGQMEEAAKLAGEGVQLGTQFGFPLWQSMNSLFYLSAQANGNKLRDIRPALQASENLHSAYRAGTTTASWVLASTLIRLQCWGEAKSLLDKTLDEIDKYEDYYCHADLLRLRSLCHMHEGDIGLATEILEQALQMATAQGAVGLFDAIRQAMKDCQLLQQKHALLQ